jgi:NarL family two-component system response regulator LiaR
VGTIRLLIADDHPLFLEGLCAVLPFKDPDLEVVGTAVDGAEAVEKARELRPDIVLLDIKMPRMSGVEAAREILRSDPNTRIIMLTTFDDRELIVDAMEAGAKGFLLKDTPTSQIIQGIHAVHDGQVLMSEAAAAKLRWGHSAQPSPQPKELAEMSSSERAVLRLMAEGKDNEQIAAALKLSEKTVRNYVSLIYDILGVNNRTQAVLWALNNGIVESVERDKPR